MCMLMRSGRKMLVLGLVSCLMASSATAQQFQQDQAQRQGIQSAQRSATTSNQSQSPKVQDFLASCLLAKNKAEIQISQLAKDKSQNEQVRQFAEQMVEEHAQLSQKLQEIASGTPGQSQTGQTGIPRGQTDSQRNQPQQSQAQSGAVDELLAIEKKIVETATNNFHQKLQGKSAKEFDQCYLSFQVGLHSQLKAALEVIGEESSGQLQQLAQSQQETVKQHLQKAESLLQQVSQQTTGTAARSQPAEEAEQFSR